jgi:hypothetical protein
MLRMLRGPFAGNRSQPAPMVRCMGAASGLLARLWLTVW